MKDRPKNSSQIESLRGQIARLEGARLKGTGRSLESSTAVVSGCGPLDRLLPERGFRRGSLVEWLADGEGTGAGLLAMLCAREAAGDGGAVVVIDQAREFYPPAAVRLGIEPARLIVVHAVGAADNAWALDQTIRAAGVAVVIAWPEEHGNRPAGKSFRRLQLAAEQSGVLGLLIRPAVVRHEPSWADARLLIEPLALRSRNRRRLRIHLLRCRGGTGGRSVEVEIDDETHTVHPAAELAHPTACRRAAGA